MDSKTRRVTILATVFFLLFIIAGIILWIFPGTSRPVNIVGDCLIAAGIVVIVVQAARLYRRRR